MSVYPSMCEELGDYLLGLPLQGELIGQGTDYRQLEHTQSLVTPKASQACKAKQSQWSPNITKTLLVTHS